MQESAVKIPPEAFVGESEIQDYLTTDIYDFKSLKFNSRPPVSKYKIRTGTIFSKPLAARVKFSSLKMISISDSVKFFRPICYINILPEGEQEILTRKNVVIKESKR